MSSDDHEQVTDRKSMTADQLRDLALQRLRKQSDFRIHLMIYLAVNGLLVVVWAWTGATVFWRSSRSSRGASGWAPTPGTRSGAGRSARSGSSARCKLDR
jgi:hypothetical protein